jgi:hypothetical protein
MSSTSGPFRSKLIGAWSLVSYTSTNIKDPNDVKYPMKKGALGMIIYSPEGHMSAQLQVPNIPPYSGGAFQGSEKEFAESARKTMAYTGPFYLEEVPGNKQRLYHHMSLAQPPNWLGDTQLRLAEMSDEREEGLFLTLGPEGNTVDGEVERVVRLRWRKMEDNSGAKVPSKL